MFFNKEDENYQVTPEQNELINQAVMQIRARIKREPTFYNNFKIEFGMH